MKIKIKCVNRVILLYYIEGNEKNVCLESVIENRKLNMNVVGFEVIELGYGRVGGLGVREEMMEELGMGVVDEIWEGRECGVVGVGVGEEKGEVMERGRGLGVVGRDEGVWEVVFYGVVEWWGVEG